MIAGLIIGFVVGVVATLVFYWRLGVDADKKYKAADQRWNAGTEQFRKAVRALEIERDEKAAYRRTIFETLMKIRALLCNHFQPDTLQEFDALAAKFGTGTAICSPPNSNSS